MIEPFIIIEGPDCTGKTTLSHHLAKKFKAMLFHATASGKLKEAMMEYQRSILDNAEVALKLDRAVVLDRHWPSEAVYGPIFRPGNPNQFSCMEHSDRIHRMNGIYVFCDRADVIKAHAAQQDPDHPYDEESFKKVVEGYRLLACRMESIGNPVVRYDFKEWQYSMDDFAALLWTKTFELHANLHGTVR